MPAILRRPNPLLPALIVSLLASASGVSRADDWPQFGFDATRSASSPEMSGATFAPAWTHVVSTGPTVATPVVADGTVVMAGGAGEVTALGAQDGIARWTRPLGDGIGATPTLDNGRITITTLTGALYSLRLDDGSVEWQRMFGGLNYGSPVLVPSAVAGQRDSVILPAGVPAMELWRLDATSGAPIWQTMQGAFASIIYSSPAVAGNRVVIGMNGGRFQGLALDSGATSWKFDAGGFVYLSSPLVRDGRVYMFPGDADGQLFAINAEDGGAIAGFPLGIPLPAPAAGTAASRWNVAVSSPTAIGGSIVVQLRQHDLRPGAGGTQSIVMREYVAAVDPAAPRVRWVHALGTREIATTNQLPTLNACPTPAGFVGEGRTFVVVSSSIAARVAVLDAASGEERWGAPLSAPGRSSPVFANGQLYVATDAGVLHTFASTWNRPPSPPARLSPSGGDCVDPARASLRWEGASDPDGDALSYQVRIGDPAAGEMAVAATTAGGQVSSPMPAALERGKTYAFAVRSRDARGAWSTWSATERFRADAACAAPPAMPTAVMTGSLDMNDGRAAGCAIGGGRGGGGWTRLLLLGCLAALAKVRRARTHRRRADR
jgi:outer membrane protein assembly factor BamB